MKTYKLKINGNEYEVAIKDIDGQNVEVEVNGKDYSVELDQPARAERPKPVIVRPSAPAPTAASPATQPEEAHAEGATKSPLPGTILSINVTIGQSVQAGDVAIVLEAMKMENNINCGRDGVVKAIYVQKGDNVLEGADLLLVE
ncbi:MAG: acetyl-CoA carboxylase biotin carboxyl carrier protein subunit [Bacteroidales bacterium]|nr:acetyl-CoA carboxylase biotin carboxyl carrier protein subunit [Bacteroidales bacterium]